MRKAETWPLGLALMGLLAALALPGSLAAPQANAQRLAWLLDGAIYEANIEYFPNHSINELTERVPKLKELGVKAIYLTPIWECMGNDAQYLIIDYYKMNPRYGTEDDLRRLVRTAHRHGIRLLLDFVTSLTYDGSYLERNHSDWILRGDDGSKQRYFPFPDWGWALDCANPEFIEYMAGVARHYVEEFDIDGWRIDSPLNNYDPAKVSGDHSRLEILRAAKAAVTEVKPDAIFLSEVTGPTLLWGDDDLNETPLFDEMCEISYNYEFCGFMGGSDEDGYSYVMTEGTPARGIWKPTLLDKVAKGQATSEEFVSFVQDQPILYGSSRANFLENHDTERVAKAFPRRHRALFVLITMMPGVPVIHSGQEVGATSPADASGAEVEKQRVQFDRGDRALEAFYGQTILIRSQHQAVQGGAFSDIWDGPKGVIAFARWREDDIVLTAVNLTDSRASGALRLPVEDWGLASRARYRLRELFSDDAFERPGAELQSVELDLEPYAYRVWTVEQPRPGA